ncbi:uncharacterized protein METZ01_LOCUS130863, partial [marine metagenome]
MHKLFMQFLHIMNYWSGCGESNSISMAWKASD